jgi:NADH:ubiquinone oxidoreductase subunit E
LNLQPIESIVRKHDSLIAILSDIQHTYSYLPEEALKAVSKLTGQPLADIYGVATFYKSFSLEPRGKHLCSCCVGTACHVRGGEAIAGEFEKQLAIKGGETTADREFTLEKVNCLGACALGPIVVVDGHYYSNVKQPAVRKILDEVRAGRGNPEIKTDKRIFPVDVRCPRCNHSLMDQDHLVDGYPSISVTTSFERKHGWVRLSCLYGSYTVESQPEIPMETVVHFFCPHCNSEMVASASCSDCNAAMVPMLVQRGGVLQICSRRGCKGHLLDLDGVNI